MARVGTRPALVFGAGMLTLYSKGDTLAGPPKRFVALG